MGIEDQKAVSKRWHEAWGTTDIDEAYADCLAPDFKALFFGQGWIDKESYIERDREFSTAFSDVKITVEEQISEGDLVFCRMSWKGRHTGDIPGAAATGRSFEIMGFCQDRFRDGRVVEHIPLFDQASLLEQLGAK
jgi:predicted ester cyclase